MKSLAVNSNNDIYIAANGNLATVSELAAIAQNCKTAMQAQRGEMQFDTERGMPNRTTVYDQYNPVQFIAAGRSTIAAVEGVISVDAFTVERNGDTLSYFATIKTIYGIENING